MRVLASPVPRTRSLGLVMPLDILTLNTTELSKPCIVSITSERDSRLRVISAKSFAQSRIVSICLPPSLEIISDSVFMHSACQVVTFQGPSKLRIIGNRAFKHSNLRFIVIPASVEKIGESCFEECRALHFVDFEPNSRLRIIENRAFTHSSVERISISSSILEKIGKQAFLCPQLVALTMNFCDTFIIENKLIMLSDRKTLVAGVDPASCVYIPSEIEVIGPSCFEMWPKLSHVFMLNSKLTRICDFAFAKTHLRYVTIPASVSHISATAFAFCSNTKLDLEAANPHFTYRDGMLLNKDETVLIRGLEPKITVPATVQALGNSCFYGFDGSIEYEPGSNLQRIEKDAFKFTLLECLRIPNRVEVIEEDAIPNPVTVPILVEPGNRHYRLENGELLDKYGVCVTKTLWI